MLSLAHVVRDVARETGRTVAQVAINWIRRQASTVIPILGARTVAQVEDDLGCLEFELTDEQVDRLSEASPVQLGFPRAFLKSDGVRGLIFGKTFDSIDQRA